MDDVTLGEMLTAAHRGQVEYCVPGGMSVSQSSSSVVFNGAGKLAGEKCRSIRRFWCHEKPVRTPSPIGFGVTRNPYSANSKFSENTQAVKVVDRSGK